MNVSVCAGALKHAEGSDNLSSGSTPSPDDRGGSNMINMSQSQLSTFSERLGATPQPRYPGSEYRGVYTNVLFYSFLH